MAKDLLVEDALALHGFFVEQRLDADAAGFGAKVPAQGIGAGEASAAAPTLAHAEFAFADEFFLAAVETFVPLAVMLPRKRLPADGAHERPFVGVRAQVRPEVVCTGEALRTQGALERCRMFLDSLFQP